MFFAQSAHREGIMARSIIQDYRAFGLRPLSGILKTRKNTMFWKLGLFTSSGEGWETPTLLSVLERVDVTPYLRI
jgi:hypothetical protein